MARQAFLVNSRGTATRRRARKTSRRRTSTSRKSVPAWVKAKGFRTWGAYMASIRPNKGGKVAKRRKRRASTARRAPVARRRRRRSYRRNAPVSYAANPRRRRRRHSFRRNPPVSLSPKGIVKTVTNAGMNAVGVLSGKVAARVGRGKIGIAGGTPVGMLTEVAIGIGGGILVKRVSARFSEMFITGALVSILEPLAKGLLPTAIGGALGDEDSLISGGGGIAGFLNTGVGSYDQGNGVGSYQLEA